MLLVKVEREFVCAVESTELTSGGPVGAVTVRGGGTGPGVARIINRVDFVFGRKEYELKFAQVTFSIFQT